MPITYASLNAPVGNATFSVAELEPDAEDADLEDEELDSDDSPDEEESDAAILPDPPA